MQNGYTSATGQQFMPSSPAGRDGAPGMDVETTLRAMGVDVAAQGAHLRCRQDGRRTARRAHERRARPQGDHRRRRMPAGAPAPRPRARTPRSSHRGERVVTTRYGVDEAICTGDHSCIRLSGCPSLTVKPNPDPLRSDPVATVIESCVGCGLCGEVAHAAVLARRSTAPKSSATRADGTASSRRCAPASSAASAASRRRRHEHASGRSPC